MHHALEIPELLAEIFAHCYPLVDLSGLGPSTLAALARTCRAFKEPALDVLWLQLSGLSQLIRCIPEAHQRYQSSQGEGYSFRRSLTGAEWDILQSYTRRIRSVFLSDRHRLSRKTIKTLSRPPNGTLFPNIRYLHFEYPHKAISIFVQPLPSLTSVGFSLNSLHSFQNSINSFSMAHPNIRNLSISAYPRAGVDWNGFDHEFIRRWRNLQSVHCHQIFLGSDILVHLSQMPLTELSFSLSDTMPHQIPPSGSVLVFPRLQDFQLRSESLDSCSRLLSWTQLPAVTKFTVYIDDCPSKYDLSSFFACIQICGIGHTIQDLLLSQHCNYWFVLEDMPILDAEDLRFCMAFSNIRELWLNIARKVVLTDRELLALVPAWPRLEILWINLEWGWSTMGGITPDGLLQLLRTCRSLYWVALAMDTRGYTECHVSRANLGFALSPDFCINLVDSFIQAESVPAIADFFAAIVPHSTFPFMAWEDKCGMSSSYREVCKSLWSDVYRRVEEILKHRC